MILVAFRHGLRASEVCDLQWHHIELSLRRVAAGRRLHAQTVAAPQCPYDR